MSIIVFPLFSVLPRLLGNMRNITDKVSSKKTPNGRVECAIESYGLQPISWNLSVVCQLIRIIETILKTCWCRELLRIVFAFIEMHLLAIYHRIRTLTGESLATCEGVGEVSDFSVVVKESGRNGSQ